MDGKRFVCKSCAAMDLCNNCMAKYKQGASVRGCVGHEFLEIPRPEWKNFAPEAVNKDGETAQNWIERLYTIYEDAVISPEEAHAIGYEGRPKNLPTRPSQSSQEDAQLVPIIEVVEQSGTSNNAVMDVDRNEVAKGKENENSTPKFDVSLKKNNSR
jgi:hypothetical protein